MTAATREEMSAAKLPLAYRDSCANLLIPLNRCRYEEYYLPWKCEVRCEISISAYATLLTILLLHWAMGLNTDWISLNWNWIEFENSLTLATDRET
jgi:hypothetical protein